MSDTSDYRKGFEPIDTDKLMKEYTYSSKLKTVTEDEYIAVLLREKKTGSDEDPVDAYYNPSSREYKIDGITYTYNEIAPSLPADLERIGRFPDYVYYCREKARAFLDATDSLVPKDYSPDLQAINLKAAEDSLPVNARRFYDAFGLRNKLKNICMDQGIKDPPGIMNEMYRLLLETEMQSAYVMSGKYNDICSLKELADKLGLLKYDEEIVRDLLYYFRFMETDVEYGKRLRFFNDSKGTFEREIMPEAKKCLLEALKDSAREYLMLFFMLPEDSAYFVIRIAHFDFWQGRKRRMETEREIRYQMEYIIRRLRRKERVKLSPAGRIFYDLLCERLQTDDEYTSLLHQMDKIVGQIEIRDCDMAKLRDEFIDTSDKIDQRCFEVASRLLLEEESPAD